MKRIMLLLLVVALSGCNGGGNSYSSTHTDIASHNSTRFWSVTTCPEARQIGDGSCNAEVHRGY